MRAKLGIFNEEKQDESLIEDLLTYDGEVSCGLYEYFPRINV